MHVSSVCSTMLETRPCMYCHLLTYITVLTLQSKQYASGALLNSTEPAGHVVHIEDSNIVIYVVLCLYGATGITAIIIIGKSSVKGYKVYHDINESDEQQKKYKKFIETFIHASAFGVMLRAVLLIILSLLIILHFGDILVIFEHNHISNTHFKTICLVVVIVVFSFNIFIGVILPIAIFLTFCEHFMVRDDCRYCPSSSWLMMTESIHNQRKFGHIRSWIFILVNISNFGVIFVQLVPVIVQFLVFPVVTTSLIIHYLAIVVIWFGFVTSFLYMLTKKCESNHTSEDGGRLLDEDPSAESEPGCFNCLIVSVVFILALIIATCLSLLFALGIIMGITAIALTGISITFIVTIIATVFGSFPLNMLKYFADLWNKIFHE